MIVASCQPGIRMVLVAHRVGMGATHCGVNRANHSVGFLFLTWRKPYDHISQLRTFVFNVAHPLRPHRKQILATGKVLVKAWTLGMFPSGSQRGLDYCLPSSIVKSSGRPSVDVEPLVGWLMACFGRWPHIRSAAPPLLDEIEGVPY